jgi:hypothetical protein
MSEAAQKAFGSTQPKEKFRSWDTSKCTHSVRQAIAEIERESNVRAKCYDRWVSEGKFTAEEGELRMGALVSAWHWLQTTAEAKQDALEDAQKGTNDR